MECKVITAYAREYIASLIGIYPEWNVKGESYIFVIGFHIDWNISRMECKDRMHHACSVMS